ncbi:hypothetical protein CRE_22626 [Caenorhabditis remanei]|uniref:RNA-directed DNA polymerase n=1 Tax=Caenorhabditis remanei TaxID=31234 RepID=E3N8T2_CAERE|nr:hypothetical protein CRE_22626 [Caenorhabditis remanei]
MKDTLTNDKKKAVFLTYLSDFARDKAEELLESKPDALFEDLVEHLKSTFQDPTRAEMERQQLRQCSQHQDESVDAFGARVRKLAQPAYVGKSREYIADKAKEAFIDGLTFTLKFHVKGESPRNFQEAQNSALKFELLLAEAAKANTITPQGLSFAPPPQNTPSQPAQPPQSAYQHQQPNFPPPPRRTVCYSCGYEGHYAADCRRRQGNHYQNRDPRNNNRGYRSNNNGGYRNNGDSRGNNGGYRNQDGGQRQQFPVNDPVQRHQIPSPQQEQHRRFVNSLAPTENPLVEQLRTELATSRAQLDALVQRNSELATAASTASPSRRINCVSRASYILSICALATFLSLMGSASALEPLVCMHYAPESYVQVPSPLDCTIANTMTTTARATPLELAIFRDNTINYRTNGTLCKVVKQVTTFSVNIFGARFQESSSKQLPVSTEACANMVKFQECEFGELHHRAGIFKTENAHIINWPSAFNIFAGTQVVETTNCFMMPTSVYSRFGSETPSSPAGSLVGCRFSDGSCTTRGGATFIWTPTQDQQCRFVFWKKLRGVQSGRIWLSEDKEFALSFLPNNSRIADCGRKIVVTDQGYGIVLPSRTKRQAEGLNELTNFVTSNQLAAQLLANEEAVLESASKLVKFGYKNLCHASNSQRAMVLSAVVSNPTMAARKLTGKDQIKAKFLGEGFLAIKTCSVIPKGSFEFISFKETCYSKPSVRVTTPANSTIVTFVDLTTRIITNRAHPVDCNLMANFEYVVNGTLFSLNPFTLELKTHPDFRARQISETPVFQNQIGEETPLIFHNLIIGSLSENMPEAHYNEIWEAMQGSPEALTRIVSAHSDPSSGPLLATQIEEAFDLWERIKSVGRVIFVIWTVVCNTVITILTLVAIIAGVARFYIGPWLVSLKRTEPKATQFIGTGADVQSPAAETPVVSPQETPRIQNKLAGPIPDCARQMKRLRSPASLLSYTDPKYFTAQIPIRVNGIHFWALVDTGAGFTVAGREICALIGVGKLNPPTVDHALGLGGNEVGMAGSATIKFEIGANTIFQTTNFTTGQCCPEGVSNYDFILGNDLLSRLPKFFLDYPNKCFEVGDEKLPLGSPKMETVFPYRYKVHVAKNTVIPPRSEAFVKCVVPLCQEEKDLVLLSQANSLVAQDLIVAPAIFVPSKAFLLVTNPTNEPKTLYANTTAATATDFVVDLSHAKLSDVEREILLSLLEEFHDVFSKNAYDLGSSKTEPVHIYTNTEVPIRGRPSRVPVKYQAELEKHINSLLRSRRITESNTPWTSPIVIVTKKNGSLRVCLDFRKLNEATIPDNFPLPRIDAILEKVGGSNFFSSLDMANGYLQLRLDASSSYKCGFITENKVYAYTHLPFGLKSAASYFQRALRTVLSGLEEEVLVYIDDILVFSKTFEQHVISLRKVLQRFRDFNLKASPKKCEFAKKAITFLGHEIGKDSYSPDKANVAKITEFPVPSNVNEVRRFVGMAGFFRKFIPKFSEIAEPLTRLTRKELKFTWDSAQQAAFEKLRTALASEPILGFPDYDKPFHIFCDASAVAQGAALMQTRPESEKDFYGIAYASRTLSDPETRWPAIQVEMGAIIFALRQFKPYICMSKIILHSDHKPLTFLLQKAKAHDNLSRWLIELQCYDIHIVHIDGKKNTVADCLSRARENESLEELTELKDIIDFPICMTLALPDPQTDHTNRATGPVGIGSLVVSQRKVHLTRKNQPTISLDFAAEQEKDSNILIVKKILKNQSPEDSVPEPLASRLTLSELAPNGTVLTKPYGFSKRALPWVPAHLTSLIFEAFHESYLSGGHFNGMKTRVKIERRYFWPGMAKEIWAKCKACLKCQAKNSPVPAYRERLRTVVTTKVFQKVGVDLTGPLRTTPWNNKYILNIVCWFSKFIVSVPLSDARSDTVARALLNECVLKYGAMTELVSDNASTFTSHAFGSFCQLLSVRHHYAIPYHSKGNGATERSFRTFHQLVSKYVNKSHTDWDSILPAITFCYNTTVHSTTGETPFFLMHGRDPTFGIDRIIDPTPAQLSSGDDNIENFRQELIANLREAWFHAKEQADKARTLFARTYDAKTRPSEIIVGDRVLFKNYLSKKDLSRKLVLPWVGQYRVLEVTPPEAVIQDICSPKKAPRRVHLDQIKKFVEITGPAATDRDEGPDSDEEAEQDVQVAQGDQVEAKGIDTTTEGEVRPLETVPEEDLDQSTEVNDNCDFPPTEGDEQQHRYNLRRNRNPPERFEAKFERR